MCFRTGVAPQLSTKALEALREAIIDDDPRLIQGSTTTPPPLQACADWPVEAACALSYSQWQGEELYTVEEVEIAFAKLCFRSDELTGEPGGIRHFLCFWDETDRKDLFSLILPEIELALQQHLESN